MLPHVRGVDEFLAQDPTTTEESCKLLEVKIPSDFIPARLSSSLAS